VARIAVLESELETVSKLNASCAIELSRFATYANDTFVALHPTWRLVRTVRALLAADATVAKHHTRGWLRALSDAFSEAVKAKWWRLDLQWSHRSRTVAASLAAWPPSSPPPVDLPVSSRPAVYTVIVLLGMLARAWYVQHRLKAELRQLRQASGLVGAQGGLKGVDKGANGANSARPSHPEEAASAAKAKPAAVDLTKPTKPPA